MNKLFFIVVIAALSMFTVLTANAQKSELFAGTITFSTKLWIADSLYSTPDDIYTISGNKIRKSIEKERFGAIITDGDVVTVTTLVNILGNKIVSTMPKEEIVKEQSALEYTYVKGEDTKIICGYICTRYDVTKKHIESGKETKQIVYTTTEIGENSNINATTYPGLTGYPLYIEYRETKTIIEIIEATEVKKKEVNASVFSIPSDYTVMSHQEFEIFLENLSLDDEDE
jgi:hypothetical protein